MNELYHLPNIRILLNNGFTDAELRALCFELPGFRPVYDQLAQNTGKAEIVAKLLEHAEKTLQLDTLLALAKERNPARYEKHRSYHLDDTSSSSPTALTREQQYQIALDWVKRGRKDSLARFDLSDANLRVAYLHGADLRESNLEGADLILANLAKTDLRMGKLQRVNLETADLTEADLRKADLSGANLRGANLSKAQLKGAYLWGANLSQTDLRGANLSGAHLSSADLKDILLTRSESEANLQGANLRGVQYDSQTKWPIGFDPSSAGAIWVD